MKRVSPVKRTICIILQCTWGICQTLIGLVVFLKLKKKYPHEVYRGSINTRWNTRSGVSLGLFIFSPKAEIADGDKIRVHEYGHCMQSILLGPLYAIVGIISTVWGRVPYFAKLRKKKNIPYTACFVEGWASKWGELASGEEAIWD